MALLFHLRRLLPSVPILGPSARTVIAEETRAGLEAAVAIAHGEVQRRTHVGATGLLRGSIMSEVRGTGVSLRGVVTTASGYALPTEAGSRPHWAPIGPLKLWARRILGDERAAYRVRWAIARRGTRGHWYFRDGAAVARPRILALFQGVQARIRQRLGG